MPQAWDDVLAAAKAVRKGNVKGYAIGIDASRFATGIYSRGGPILSDDQKKAVFNNDQGVAQIAFYQQVITSGAGYQTAKAGDDQTDFVAGKAAFFFASSTRISQLQQDVPTGANFRWGAAMPPHGTGLNPVADMYGGNVMIFKSTPEKQLAAWLLIKYFTSRDVTPAWSVATGYLPVRTSGLYAPQVQAAVQSSPQYAVAMQSQAYGRPEPNVRQ